MGIYILNKYTNTYYRIVNHSLSENRLRKDNRKYEQHHIIPKSCGGSDDRSNLVLLTPKEHYICHRLLPKMVKSKLHYEKMVYAIWGLINGNGRSERYSPSGKIYQQIKEEQSVIRSKRMSDDNPYQKNEVKILIKKTMLEKYGVENISQLDAAKEKKKNTCLRNYGVENPLQSPKIREKIKSSNIEKYGVDHNMKSKEVREKAKNTFLANYGVDNPSKSDSVKNKIRIKAKARTNRPIVLKIKAFLKENEMKLAKGWHNKSDEKLYDLYEKLISF